MLWTLIRKELLTNLLTLRLSVALVFTVVLCTLTTWMGSLDFSASTRAYEAALKERDENFAEATIYQHVQPSIILAPQPLHILSRGASQARAMRWEVNVEEYYEGTPERVGSSQYDDLMRTLVRADFTTVVALLLSFLAVVLGFDCICGEREQGTLRLLLANSVPRAYVATAKLVGGLLSLWVPLAVAFALSLLILLGNPDVHLSADDWSRLGLLLVLSCLTVAAMFAFSAMVSSLTRTSSTSLIICLFAWLVLGVGYANALPALTRYGIDYPPWTEYIEQARAEYGRRGEFMEDWDEKHPPPGGAYLAGHTTRGVLRYAHPIGYEWRERRAEVEFDRTLELADFISRARKQNQWPLAEQEFAVDRWSILSPLASYRTMAKYLARSSLDDLFHIVRYGFQYRLTYIDYLRTRMESTSWRRWFSDEPPGREPMIADPETVTEEMLLEGSQFMIERQSWVAEQEERARDDPQRQLDLTDLPKHGDGWRRSLPESLALMGPGLAVLAAALAAFVAITVRRFMRYEV